MWTSFRAQIAACASHGHAIDTTCTACIEPLQRAADCYAHDFLAGFMLDDCPDFSEWQQFHTEELRASFASVLDRLIAIYQTQEGYGTAIDFAHRRLQLDLMHEPAHRMLMRLFALAGQRSAAVRQYKECQRILAEDLNIAPSAETTALHEAIRTRQFPTADLPKSSLSPSPTPRSEATNKPHHNLPTQTTSFVGREQDVDAICQLLTTDDDCRLLTLIGPGGIGKTRLALRVAQTLIEKFDSSQEIIPRWDGIYFIPLASVADETDLVSAMANAVGYSFRGSDNPQSQLIEFLRPQTILLVIDNFEHLLDGATLLSSLLMAAPNLFLLVTSREALDLSEEWLYPIGGLSQPVEGATSAEIAANNAVKLFVERAQQVQRGFSLTAEISSAVVHICRLVDGMPLGLELAAAWTDTLTVAEIANEIAENLDILASDLRNIPERHRSLRAVFEQTWRRLTQVEQQTLRRLAIFRGTFTREAAQEVTNTSLTDISSLVHKTLCRYQAGRYDIHELLRQFAFSHLTEIEESSLQAQHGRYFSRLLATEQQAIMTAAEPDMLQTITDDFDNILAAWRYLSAKVQGGNRVAYHADLLKQYVPVLSAYFDRRSMFWEGDRIFQQALLAIQHMRESEVGNDSTLNALYYLLRIEQIGIRMHLGHYHEAKQMLLQLLPEMRVSANTQQLAKALTYLGPAHMRVGEYAAAEQFLDEAIRLYQQLDLQLESTIPLINLGLVKARCEEYEAARSYYQRAVAYYEAVSYATGLARCLSNIGSTFPGKEEIHEAISYYEQALRIARRSNNRLWIAIILTNLGDCAYTLGHYQEARTKFADGLAIFRELREIRWITVTLADSSFLLIALNELHDATTNLIESLTLAKEFQLIGDGLQALAGSALLLEHQQQFGPAVTIANYVVGDSRTRSTAYETCEQVLERLGDRMTKATFTDAEFHGNSMPFDLIMPYAIQTLKQSLSS